MSHPEALREILGIPLDEQPASYYRLLGLDPKDASREAIENAAYRQSMLVSAYRGGPWEGAVEPLLNLLEEARSYLVDPVSRAVYDQSLRAPSDTLREEAKSGEELGPRSA